MSSERDPHVTDLRRYRRERERAQREAAKSKPTQEAEPFLGSRPRAGLFLVLVILVLAALWFLQLRL